VNARFVLAAASALAITLTACGTANDVKDAATKEAASRAASALNAYSDPWAAGCLAADLALRANHVDRAQYLNSLQVLADAPGLPKDFTRWVKDARSIIALSDPTTFDQKTKDKLNGPCKDHNRPLVALG